MRGGAANCEVKIGDEDLQSPYCYEPDILLTMSESAIDSFEERLKPGGVLLVNSSLVDPDRKYRDDIKVIKVMAPMMQMGEVEGEEELLVAITSSEHLSRQLRVVRQRLRNSLRSNNGGGGAPPSGNPFKEPVDQYQMADSIIEVMEGFFHGEEKCDIYDMNFTKMEFCVMMHIFFKKIHFLKKETRLQFSKFLQNKVFAGKSGFIRSFNTYADMDIYKAFEEQLDIKQFNFFRNHPVPIPIEKKPSDYHQRMMLDMSTAFQEIGWAFQKSAYFKKLKKLKETMNDFVLQ
jgi:hypothetical protein